MNHDPLSNYQRSTGFVSFGDAPAYAYENSFVDSLTTNIPPEDTLFMGNSIQSSYRAPTRLPKSHSSYLQPEPSSTEQKARWQPKLSRIPECRILAFRNASDHAGRIVETTNLIGSCHWTPTLAPIAESGNKPNRSEFSSGMQPRVTSHKPYRIDNRNKLFKHLSPSQASKKMIALETNIRRRAINALRRHAYTEHPLSNA